MNMFAEPLENIVGMNKREGQFLKSMIQTKMRSATIPSE